MGKPVFMWVGWGCSAWSGCGMLCVCVCGGVLQCGEGSAGVGGQCGFGVLGLQSV